MPSILEATKLKTDVVFRAAWKTIVKPYNRMRPDICILVLAIASIACSLLMGLQELLFLFFGGVAYSLVAQMVERTVPFKLREIRQSPPRDVHGKAETEYIVTDTQLLDDHWRKQPYANDTSTPPSCAGDSIDKIVCPSRNPTFPTLKNTNFNTQVDELLDHIAPTPESNRVAQRIASIVKNIIQKNLPDVEVMGVASGNMGSGTAFGVAVPEIDVVASINPVAFAARFRLSKSRDATHQLHAAAKLEARKLQKSAIRACTDWLVTSGAFKFRRSAFRGPEPKVTLIAPANLGVRDQSVPLDFWVNSAMPLHNVALLAECRRMDPRAEALIMLVRRWAKYRGICNAAAGHLPPYAWTLLVIYFMQVGCFDNGDPLLPPLKSFSASSGFTAQINAFTIKSGWVSPVKASPMKSVGELFQRFVAFYSQDFDWRNEAAAVQLGKRAAPDLSTKLHVVVRKDGNTIVAPTIPDPFEPGRNVSTCLGVEGIDRLQEELLRAHSLCVCGALLTDLLEPWRPESNECARESNRLQQ